MEVAVRAAAANVEVVGSGRPILFLHGIPTDHRQMRLVFEPAFRERSGWQRIYPDLPGMGRTPGPAWIHDADGLVEWGLELADAVLGDGTSFALAGVSFGAYLALRMLERQPERIDGLLLQVPVVVPDPARRRLPERTVIVPAGPELAAELEPRDQAWLDVAVIQTPETLHAFRQGARPGAATADVEFLNRLAPPSIEAAISTIPFQKPTLIVAGRQDHLAGHADATDLLAAFPRATLAILDGAGHALAAERPSLLEALVRDWLERIAAAPPSAADQDRGEPD